MANTFADRVKSARKAARLSQEAVGRLVGVSGQAVYSWEIGRTKPEADHLAALAKLLGVSASYLLTGGTPELTLGQMQPSSPSGRVVPRFAPVDAVNDARERVIAQIHTHFPCGPRSYVVALWDDSNAPEYMAGDQVVLDPDLSVTPGDMVLASRGPKRLPFFGRYVRRFENGQTIELVEHLNPLWGSISLTTDDTTRVHAVMTEHARRRRS
jgi:transcriptional regulator with XRE-family HTH domain